MTGNILAQAMKASFDNWVSNDPTYSSLAKKLTPRMYEMFYMSLSEMPNYKPGTYNLWFIMNHMRFKDIRQEDKTLMNEMAHHFLTKYVRNELESVTKKEGKRKTGRRRGD